MRIATYNVNNLFHRAKLFELDGFNPAATSILNDIDQLERLLEEPNYQTVQTQLTSLLSKYFSKNATTEYFTINVVRGKLYSVNSDGTGVTLKAKGKQDWDGWIEAAYEMAEIPAYENTGKVISKIKPDIICIVECEGRNALQQFNDTILQNLFKYNMSVEGNDPRGINVGIYSNLPITNIDTHIFDTYASNERQYKIFSRDCAEYEITLKSGQKLHMLCNHLKSQGYGTQQDNDRKRKLQAEQVNKILKNYDLNKDFVIVAGDFNATPQSASLQPLLSNISLINVVSTINGSQGTYLKTDDQLDYLLVSTALNNKMTNVGIERRGIFNNGQVTPFNTVTNAATQASDHALVWADFDIN